MLNHLRYKLNRSIFLFIVFFSVPYCYPQSYNKTLNDAIQLAYNLKSGEAISLYDRLITLQPDNPLAYYHKSNIYFWRFMSAFDDEDYKQFMKLSEIAIDKSSEWMSENGVDEDMQLFTGNCYTFRAIALARRENYLECIWAAQKANSFLNAIYKNNPENYDAYLGLGLFKVFLAQVPSSFKWALEVIGFKADLETGVKWIELAADKAVANEIEAKFYYSFILSEILQDFETSEQLLIGLSRRYPDNILFNYFIAVNQIKQNKFTPAETNLKRIIKENRKNFPKLNALAQFLAGDINYFKGNYRTAIQHYTNFLNISKDKDYKGIAALRLGFSYELSGDRQSAEGVYQLTSDGNKNLEEDVYAARKGQEYLKKLMTHHEALLLKAKTQFAKGMNDSAIASLLFVLKESEESAVKMNANLLLGDYYLSVDRAAEAVSYLTASLESPKNSETWLLPYTYYYLSKAAILSGDLNQYAEYKMRLGEYNDYDFAAALKAKVFALDYKVIKIKNKQQN